MLSKRYASLDALFSEYIRKRAMAKVGGCERCLHPKASWKQLQCSHYHGRRKASTRFDEDNAMGLCGACHLYFTANPLEHTEFIIRRLGQERFDMLTARANWIGKADLEAVRLYIQARLAEIV